MIESQLDVGGAVVFWTASEFTDRDRLKAGLRSFDLDTIVPEPRPPASVLKDALEEVFGGSRVLVRPLADRDGFTVVREERGKTANYYTTDLVARVQGSRLDFEPFDDRATRVNEAFRRHAGRIPAVQLSACLVKIVEHLGGTRLRPTGAVYWIPGPKLEEWASITEVVEAASEGRPSALYLLRHRLDSDAVRAIRDALVHEVQHEVERIHDDVYTGELGGRALETRKKQASELRDKVLLYEHLLSVGLSDLHRVIDQADHATAAAVLLLSAQSDSPSLVPTTE